MKLGRLSVGTVCALSLCGAFTSHTAFIPHWDRSVLARADAGDRLGATLPIQEQPEAALVTGSRPGDDRARRPSHAEGLKWRGEFLAAPNFRNAFMYPGWPPDKRQAYRDWLKARGLTHIPFAPMGRYRGEPYDFDYRQNVAAFRALIEETQNDGCRCVVALFALTDGYSTVATEAQAAAFIRSFVPQINDLVRVYATGWEFPQIAGWAHSGAAHLRIARVLRDAAGPDALVFAHFPPERISGHGTGHDSEPQDYRDWWREASAIDGLLAQRPHNEEIRYSIAHLIGGRDARGGTDIGDAERITRLGKAFVVFELGRNATRNRLVCAAALNDPRVSGCGAMGDVSPITP